MVVKPIASLHEGFTSWCLLPTVMCGTWERGYECGGWVYLHWIKGRLGLRWTRECHQQNSSEKP